MKKISLKKSLKDIFKHLNIFFLLLLIILLFISAIGFGYLTTGKIYKTTPRAENTEVQSEFQLPDLQAATPFLIKASVNRNISINLNFNTEDNLPIVDWANPLSSSQFQLESVGYVIYHSRGDKLISTIALNSQPQNIIFRTFSSTNKLSQNMPLNFTEIIGPDDVLIYKLTINGSLSNGEKKINCVLDEEKTYPIDVDDVIFGPIYISPSECLKPKPTATPTLIPTITPPPTLTLAPTPEFPVVTIDDATNDGNTIIRLVFHLYAKGKKYSAIYTSFLYYKISPVCNNDPRLGFPVNRIYKAFTGTPPLDSFPLLVDPSNNYFPLLWFQIQESKEKKNYYDFVYSTENWSKPVFTLPKFQNTLGIDYPMQGMTTYIDLSPLDRSFLGPEYKNDQNNGNIRYACFQRDINK